MHHIALHENFHHPICISNLLLQGSVFLFISESPFNFEYFDWFLQWITPSLPSKFFYIIFYLLYISNVKKKEYYCSNVKLELTAKAIKTFYPQISCILKRSQKIMSQIRVMPFISAINSGVEANWDWYKFSKPDSKRQRKHIEMNSFYPPCFPCFTRWSQKMHMLHHLRIQYHASRLIWFKHALKHDVYISKFELF